VPWSPPARNLPRSARVTGQVNASAGGYFALGRSFSCWLKHRWPTPRLTPDQAALAQQLYDAREKTVQQIADLFHVPRTTVYNHLTTSQPPAPRTPAPTP
jgi:DNA invertase Pin-like site-specific DNA recombinase